MSLPAFEKPWHAQVYALKEACLARGMFTGPEWSEALGAALGAARRAGPVDGGDGFWLAWQDALEGLVAASGAAPRHDVTQTAEAWRSAYLATPHGAPVRLAPTKNAPPDEGGAL